MDLDISPVLKTAEKAGPEYVQLIKKGAGRLLRSPTLWEDAAKCTEISTLAVLALAHTLDSWPACSGLGAKDGGKHLLPMGTTTFPRPATVQ